MSITIARLLVVMSTLCLSLDFISFVKPINCFPTLETASPRFCHHLVVDEEKVRVHPHRNRRCFAYLVIIAK